MWYNSEKTAFYSVKSVKRAFCAVKFWKKAIIRSKILGKGHLVRHIDLVGLSNSGEVF